jgi:hypothetical protein
MKGSLCPENADAAEGPQARLEKMYLEEFLHGKGLSIEALRELPEEEARQIMKEACRYASMKLAEVEARAQLRKDIHVIP